MFKHLVGVEFAANHAFGADRAEYPSPVRDVERPASDDQRDGVLGPDVPFGFLFSPVPVLPRKLQNWRSRATALWVAVVPESTLDSMSAADSTIRVRRRCSARRAMCKVPAASPPSRFLPMMVAHTAVCGLLAANLSTLRTAKKLVPTFFLQSRRCRTISGPARPPVHRPHTTLAIQFNRDTSKSSEIVRCACEIGLALAGSTPTHFSHWRRVGLEVPYRERHCSFNSSADGIGPRVFARARSNVYEGCGSFRTAILPLFFWRRPVHWREPHWPSFVCAGHCRLLDEAPLVYVVFPWSRFLYLRQAWKCD